MTRNKFLIVFALLFVAVSLFGCGGDKPNASDPLASFTPNKAELGEDWKQFKHDTSFGVWVFSDAEYPTRPAEHRTPKQARVFYNGEVTAEELNLVDEGLTEMLSMCRRDHPSWQHPNLWTKFAYFQTVPEFKVIQVPSNYTLQEGEAAGCAGMITGAHGAYTAAGTVGGLVDRINSTVPASRGGIYILIPKQTPEQLARTECKQLMKNAVRNEGEHIFFTNSGSIFFAYANDGDGNGSHPYCAQ